MSRVPVNRLLLHKQALVPVAKSRFKEVAEGGIDIHAARRIALWRQSSGAEVYLFALLTTASREIARHYLLKLGLQPGLSTIHLSGAQHALPGLATAYARAILIASPAKGFAPRLNRGWLPLPFGPGRN